MPRIYSTCHNTDCPHCSCGYCVASSPSELCGKGRASFDDALRDEED